MSDLISRSAVLDIINEERRFSESLREIIEYDEDRAHNAGELSCAIQLERKVKKIPAIDAVSVVRCKDCALRGHCAVEDMFTLSGFTDGYCRAGKRVSNVVSGARMDAESEEDA